MRWTPRRLAGTALASALLFSVPAAAHIGGLGGTTTDGSVPPWLTVVTGGIVIGASFLFTSLLTDHEAIRAVNGWGLSPPLPAVVRTTVTWALRAASVVVLALVVADGFLGPPDSPVESFAILVVWAGWWAGYTMSVYLVGNTWPLLNPWRAIASVLPRIERRSYPERLGAWPSVVGLLAMVWVEVVSPVSEDPALLAALIVAYTLVTLVGASIYGPETWFGTVDPIARVFRAYGRIAPVRRTGSGIEFTVPTAALTRGDGAATPGATAFVIALLWVTTYDGLVSTAAWAAAVAPVVRAGVPPLLLYLIVLLVGFGLFLAAYRLASRKARDTAGTYVSAAFIERWFVPSLLPIAAGYHAAHFLGYFLGLVPALFGVLAHPLSTPPTAQVLVVPEWFGVFELALVLLGHMLAVWVGHSLSFDLFPGVFKPIRSQYPFIAVMIFYTMTSMWIILQPFVPPPYV